MITVISSASKSSLLLSLCYQGKQSNRVKIIATPVKQGLKFFSITKKVHVDIFSRVKVFKSSVIRCNLKVVEGFD